MHLTAACLILPALDPSALCLYFEAIAVDGPSLHTAAAAVAVVVVVVVGATRRPQISATAAAPELSAESAAAA